MDITVTLTLGNMPDDTDLEVVESVIRRQLNEWLDFDQHPDDLEITCHSTQ